MIFRRFPQGLRKTQISFLALLVLSWTRPVGAQNLGRESDAALGKTVISVGYPDRLEIPLPGNGFYELNHDLKDVLNRKLTESGRFIVLEERSSQEEGGALIDSFAARKRLERSGYEWPSRPIASAELEIRVPELSFRAGARGDRTLYGWDERMQDPFTLHPEWGVRPGTNEFESRSSGSRSQRGEVTFFGNHFAPNDARDWVGSFSGLDLSEGLSLNFLLAYMRIVLRTYTARVVFEVRAHQIAQDQWQIFRIPAQTSGFYFDVSAGYLGYSGGLIGARQDAMLRAVKKTVDSAAQEISAKLRRTTRVAQLEGIIPATSSSPERALLATGPHSGIPPGVIFFEPQTGYRVTVSAISSTSGSVADVISEGSERPLLGTLLYEEVSEGGAGRALAADTGPQLDGLTQGLVQIDTVEADSAQELPVVPNRTDISSVDFSRFGIKEESDFKLFFQSVAGAVLLPYRIYRWWKYDQSYHKKPDRVISGKKELRSLQSWVEFSRNTPWARQIGLDQAPALPEKVTRNPVVAVIDTGLDYNHPVIHSSVAIRVEALADRWGQKERIGWDYISGDSRPFDENDHGTELTSLVLAVAPHARILPLKAFNAWGMTSSQALYSSVLHAIRAQVDVILFGASTLRDSRALQAAIQLANDAGIPVVVPAGDEGMNLDYLQQRSYPASLYPEQSLLVPVVAIDQRGLRLGEGVHDPRKTRSNFASGGGLPLAAPGDSLPVLRPRVRRGLGEGTAYSAALVAGALAREFSLEHEPQTLESRIQQAREVIDRTLSAARRSAKLERVVEHGRSLWITN